MLTPNARLGQYEVPGSLGKPVPGTSITGSPIARTGDGEGYVYSSRSPLDELYTLEGQR